MKKLKRFAKSLPAIVCAVLTLAFMTACSETKQAESAPEAPTPPPVSNTPEPTTSPLPSFAPEPTLDAVKQAAEPQGADGMVTLVIPASLFTTTTEEQVMADAQAQGVEVTKNADGSYTYVMTAEQQQKTLDDFRRQLVDNMAQIPEHDAYKDSVKSFAYNEDFSEIKITLSRKAFDENPFAQMAVRVVCLLAPNYQAFSGNPTPATKVSLIDASTGEAYETASSPDDFINQ